MKAEALLSQLPGYVFWKDLDSNYIGANDAFTQLAELKNRSIDGLNDFELPWAELANEYRADDQTAIQSGPLVTLESVSTANGNVIGVVEKCPIQQNGKVIGVACQLTPKGTNQNKLSIPVCKKAIKHAFEGITLREAQVLYYIIRGSSMRMVAAQLSISAKTVESHIENAKQKFQVRSKPELVNQLINSGFLNCIPEGLSF